MSDRSKHVDPKRFSEFMKRFRGVTAYNMAAAVSNLTPGINWRGCSKGHIAEEWALAQGGSYYALSGKLKHISLNEIEDALKKHLKSRAPETAPDTETDTPPSRPESVASEVTDKHFVDRRLNHAGAIGLLCELSVHLRHSAERDEQLDSIERCVGDFAKITGGSVRRVLHRIEYAPPSVQSQPKGAE